MWVAYPRSSIVSSYAAFLELVLTSMLVGCENGGDPVHSRSFDLLLAGRLSERLAPKSAVSQTQA